MNRREFNTSLAAVAAAPFLPLPAAAASRPAALPAGTYAWAKLIARAQNKCSPAMLARHLRIAPDAAGQVFNELLHDGVLRAPGVTGSAQASQPIDTTGISGKPVQRSLSKLRELMPIEEQRDDAAPLVKDDPTCLGCDSIQSEEDPHASTPQSVQSSPEER